MMQADFDCLTEVIGEPNTAKMSEQIPVEFEEEVDSKSDHSFESVNSSGSNADNEGADDSVESIDPFDMICGDDMARGESKRPEPESAESAVLAEPEPESIEEIDPFDMICGDDISRLPDVVNPNEKKPETIEEEKPSYAAVARSRPTSECNDNELVEDPVVEDVVEEPVQAAAPSVSATPKVEAAQPEAETEGKQSRAERKTKKAMMKLGLAPVDGINRVVLRKDKTLLFVVPNPEVFRKGDTWVVLGEARVEDPNQRAREMAAAKVAENIQPKTKTEPVQATITEEDEETDVPADGVEEKDIELVMQQAACTRAKAISALKSNSNDIVNAIMELTL
jgi:nascent polypeptide-associated complex subunit alpha